MADIVKFEKRAKSPGEGLPVELKRFIDAVIVPALVREYRAAKNVTNILAPEECVVAHSGADVSLLCEVPL